MRLDLLRQQQINRQEKKSTVPQNYLFKEKKMNIQSHFQHTKYIETYFKIIFRAQSENRKRHKKNHPNYVYYERHHILPKSIWSKFKDLKANKWNGVLLTAKEHFICHLLLWKHYKKSNEVYELRKMARAFNQMQMNRGLKINSAMYGKLRLDMSHSDSARAKMSAARKGISTGPKSPETRAKLSAAKKGRKLGPRSPETRAKLSAAKKGKTHSPETRAKMSAAKKGRKPGPRSPETRAKISEAKKGRSTGPLSPETRAKLSEAMKNITKIKCEHCGTECSPQNHSRWHVDKCKFKTFTPF